MKYFGWEAPMVSSAMVVPELRAAGLIGIWNTNVAAGRSILDEGAAALLAGNASLAGEPLPLEVALSRAHPDDRGWVFERIRRVRQTGGPFSAEFRILAETGEIRWVLNRGTLAPDQTGAMYGCGVYIDTTDSHQGPFIAPALRNQDWQDPLTTAADRCIEVHTALQRSNKLDLRHLSGTLLFGIGRALAERQSG